MTIDLNLLTAVLYVIVAMMIIIVLYHVLFIVWDLRKIVRRFEDMTSQVETVLMKPLSMAEEGIAWAIDFIQTKAKDHHRKKHQVRAHLEDNADEETSD